MPPLADSLWCAVLAVLLVLLIVLLVRAVRVNRLMAQAERDYGSLRRLLRAEWRAARPRRERWAGPSQVAEEARMQWYAPVFDSVHS